MTRAIDIPDDACVMLRGISVSLRSDVGRAFISDAARNSEGLINDGQLAEKYGLSIEAWRQLVKTHKALTQAVRAERERRVRSGLAAQESAAKVFAEAPKVLGDILQDKSANPRHRIEAARELRQTAIGNGETTPDPGERFVITINLGGEKLVFDKTLAPNAPNPDKDWEMRNDDVDGK
jgi:hypothetical protein